jgi:hypothetical protein
LAGNAVEVLAQAGERLRNTFRDDALGSDLTVTLQNLSGLISNLIADRGKYCPASLQVARGQAAGAITVPCCRRLARC